MTGKVKPILRGRIAARRRPRRILGLVLCAILAVSGVLMLAEPVPAADADPVKVVGRWVRRDGGYVLELRNPTFDGRLAAAYFNPRPINVSRS
jgi:hypothetical protein